MGHKTDQHRQYIRRLLRAAGSRKELIRWIDEEAKSTPPRRGRPRNDYFRNFAAYADETYGPLWNIDRKREIAALKARGVKPPKGGFKFMTPYQTAREFVEAVWKAHDEAWNTRHLGRNKSVAVHRLARDLRAAKKLKAKKKRVE